MPSAADILQSALADAVKSAGTAREAVGAINDAQSNDIAALVSQVGARAAAQKVIDSETARLAAEAQQKRDAVRGQAGGEAALLESVRRTQEESDKLVKATEEVASRRSLTVFDFFKDPMATLKGVVTLGDAEAKLEGQVLRTQAAVQATDMRHKSLTYAAQETNLFAATTSAAMTEAHLQKAAAVAEIDAASARIDGRKHNLQGIHTALQMSAAEIDTLYKSYSVEQNAKAEARQERLDKQAIEWHQEQVARDLRDYNLRVRSLNEQIAARKDAANERAEVRAERQAALRERDAELAFYSERLREGMSTLGMTAPDGDALKLALKRANQAGSPEATALAVGMRNYAPGGTKNTIGINPAESYTLFSQYNLPVTAQMEKSLGVLKTAQELLAKDKTAGDLKPGSKEWAQAYNAKVTEVVKHQYEVSLPGSGTLGDISGHLATYVTSSPDLAQLPVTQKFLRPLLETNQNIGDPRVLLPLLATAVQKGQVTATEAAGMATIYRKSMHIHAEQQRLLDLGIKVPEAMQQYIVPLKLSGFTFGSAAGINLANPAEMQQYLARETASRTFGGRVNMMLPTFNEPVPSISERAKGSYLNNPSYGNPSAQK